MKSLYIEIKARVGNQVGLGHWQRSLYLAKELMGRGHQIFLVPLADHPEFEKNLPSPLGHHLSSHHPDVLVIDDPIQPTLWSQSPAKKIALDYYGNPEGFFDAVISPIDRTPVEVVQSCKTPRFSGIPYLILDPGANHSTLPEHGRRALFVLGGRDSKRRSLPLLKILCGHFFNSNSIEELKVILPEDHADFQEVKKLLETIRIRAQLLTTQPTLIPWIQWSNLVFCNGGMTAALTLLQKRKAVFLPQTVEEEEFLEFLGVPNKDRVNFKEQLNSGALLGCVLNATSVTSPPHPAPFHKELDGLGSKRISEIIERLVDS